MKDELEAKLKEKYPNLYRSEGVRWALSGFECGDGWFNLLDECSAKIEAELVQMNMRDRHQFYAQQIKEKFGTLRFYMNSSTEAMNKAISEAEEKSYVTCEECGAGESKQRQGGWIRTLCDDCLLEDVIEKVKRFCIDHSEIYDKEIKYGENKGKTRPAVRFKDEEDLNKRLKANIAGRLELNMNFKKKEEEKNDA